MTDEELKSVGRVIGAFSSGSYAQGFEAGYRAWVEEALTKMYRRSDHLDDDWYDLKFWFESKLKEQP